MEGDADGSACFHTHRKKRSLGPPAAPQRSQKAKPQGQGVLAGAGRLCPGPAAQDSALALPIAVGLEGDGGGWRGQYQAELSPQRLLDEDEGRRGRRLTHGTWYQPGCWAVSLHQLEIGKWSQRVPQTAMAVPSMGRTGSSLCPPETHSTPTCPKTQPRGDNLSSGHSSRYRLPKCHPALQVPRYRG